jgi:hypothetical protein
MTANLISRYLRVLIGADEQDWSSAAGVFQCNRTQISETGFLEITADLELLPVIGAPESLDPQVNPERWARGNPVLIQIRDDSGDWIDHPQGRLNLLEEPEFPEPGAGITLSLGCILAKHNGFEFDDDKTGVVVGTAENCATVAQRLLEANEIPTGSIDLGTWPYAIAIPKGKEENANFIGQAGGLAYSNDWRYLYQDIAGDVVDAVLDLSYAAPLVTITLGENDPSYLGIKVDRTPPNRVKVAGLGAASSEGANPSVAVAEVTGDRSQFEEGVVSCPGTGVISRSRSVTSWSESAGIVTYRTETVQSAPRSAVSVRPGLVSQPCDLIDWRKGVEVKRYDMAVGGRLIDTVTTESQRRFTFTAKVEPRLSFAVIRETTITPYYSDSEVISKIVTEESQARGIIDPNTDDPLAMVDARYSEVRWEQLGTQNWRKIESDRIPRALTRSSPDSDPAAIVGTATVSTSNTGANQPPRAEIWDGGVIAEDIEFQGEAFYTPPGGLFGRIEKALYQVPYGFSQEQCEGLALKWVQVIAGRHRAALIEFPVSDALLAAPPLFPCDVVMPSGEIRHYRVDGLSWEHSETICKAVGTGILVATTAAPSVEVPSPTPLPVTSVEVVASTVPVVSSSIPVVAMV